MFKVKVERYADIVSIQIPNSKRLNFIQILKQVPESNGLILHSVTGEQVSLKRSSNFIVDVSNKEKISIELPLKDWTSLIEALQEHLDENRDFPLDHSFEPYGAKIIPDIVKDVVIETFDDQSE